MTNKQIYKQTLTFSLHRLLFDILSFLMVGGLATVGFVLMDKTTDKGLIGLGLGLVFGLILVYFILRYSSYNYKAGQIAMMTHAITEGELPEDVLSAGKKIVKERFITVAVFFGATRLINGIFSQLSRGLTSLGNSIGGEKGGNVASAITGIIQIVINFLCDCCLGWVFFRKDQNAGKATCEGAVLFFKNGKALLKNLGRIFGMGLVSLLCIGGAFTALFYGIFSAFPATFELLTTEIAEAATRLETTVPELLSSPDSLMIVFAAAAALIVWGILHSVFVRPFILVGVLRNFMEAGVNNIPTEESFALLDKKSDKFKKLHAQI